jgi:hypothetical protein
MHQLDIAAADLVVIGIYFAIVFAIGFHLARRTHDSMGPFPGRATPGLVADRTVTVCLEHFVDDADRLGRCRA